MVTSSNITGIHHVSLIVSDTDRSVRFYTDILGLTQTARPVLPFPGAWLQAGSQQIHLLEVDNPDPVAGRPAAATAIWRWRCVRWTPSAKSWMTKTFRIRSANPGARRCSAATRTATPWK